MADRDHSDIPDFIWLWSMAAIFAFAAIYPDGMAYELRTGLAAILFMDVYGAILVFAVYMQSDFQIGGFRFPIYMAMFVMTLIVLLKVLGMDLYAAFALVPVVRWAYDIYAYIRAPYATSDFHARRYFTIFLHMAIPLACLLVLAPFSGDLEMSFPRDDQFLQCETTMCKLFSPPDPFIIFGLFLYPLMGWLNFKWKPEWMRWVPSPKHITD